MLKTVSTQLALASDTLSEILAKGNTSGSNDIAMDAGYGIGQSDGLATVDFPGSNVITASTSGEESFRVDAQGQLRLKNSTPAWDTTFSALVTKGGFVTSQNSNYFYSGQNSYFNGAGFKYSVDGYSTLYEQSFGQHSFYSSVSGTAGDLISYVPKMTLDPDGVLYPVGGINLGGTAAANLLDDYEEGVFSPIYIGSSVSGSQTYTVQAGFYEKIGRLVNFRIRLIINAKGTIAGNISIGGLPFASAGTASSYGQAFASNAAQLAITAGTSITGFVDLSATTVNLKVWSATTGTADITDANLTNTSQIFISGNYFVA